MSVGRDEITGLVVRGASDLHGFLPAVEPCDVLLLAGDLVPLEIQEDMELSWRWFSDVFARWLEKVPAGEVVAIGGNHDFLLDRLHRRLGAGVHAALFDAGWIYLQDAGTTLGCGLKVWGTPWSPGMADWAFMGHDHELAEFFDRIPTGLDVLLTHTPPYGKGDRAPREINPLAGWLNAHEHIGSRTLQSAIHRAKPRLVVYGHVHADGGWRLDTPDTRYANVSVLDEDYYLVRPTSEPLLPEP
jgi:hypothetical protein